MASKKTVIEKVSVIALLLVFSATAFALSDSFVRAANGKKNGNSIACCDTCYCTKSWPPQCRCADVFPDPENRCDGCEKCFCFETLPLKCSCDDVTDFCPPPCSADADPPVDSFFKTKFAPN